MMKTLAAAALSLPIVLAAAGAAEAAKVRWFGVFHVEAASDACPAGTVGQVWQARLRPSGVGTNGPTSTLSLYSLTGAQNFRVKGRFGPKFRQVDSYSIYDTENDVGKVPLRFASQQPKTLKASVRFVNVTGQIRNFDENPGCEIDFAMALVKKIED